MAMILHTKMPLVHSKCGSREVCGCNATQQSPRYPALGVLVTPATGFRTPTLHKAHPQFVCALN